MEIWYFYLENSIDLDNLAKPICDALKKLVYEDDRQIVELHLRKIRLGTFDAQIGPFELKEEQAVTAVAARYQQRGYEVLLQPPANLLPKALRRFRPDVL